MKYRIKNLSILLNSYLNSIKELIDFSLVQEAKETKEKILINIFYKLYFDIKKNNFTGPEFIHVYRTAIKIISKNRVFRKKINISDMNLEDKNTNLVDFDLNKLKKTILFFSIKERLLLYFMHNNVFSPRELSLIFNISEGTIYSTISRTKKFIIKYNLKDVTILPFKTKDECFFIENFLVKFNKNKMSADQKLKTKQHLLECKNCNTLNANMALIDEEIAKFKASEYSNLANKIYIKIHRLYKVELFIKKLFINNITKSILALILLFVLYKNIEIPGFNNNKNELLLSTYLKEDIKPVEQKITEVPETVVENKVVEKPSPDVEPLLKQSITVAKSNIETAATASINSLYKLSISSNKWKNIDESLIQILNKYKVTQAGVIALGSEKYGGSYYHLYVDQNELNNFLKDISPVATFEISKEKETREIPKDKARMVIWVGRTE